MSVDRTARAALHAAPWMRHRGAGHATGDSLLQVCRCLPIQWSHPRGALATESLRSDARCAMARCRIRIVKRICRASLPQILVRNFLDPGTYGARLSKLVSTHVSTTAAAPTRGTCTPIT